MTAPRVWFPGAFADDNFLSLVAAPRAAGFEKDALTDDAQGKLLVADSAFDVVVAPWQRRDTRLRIPRVRGVLKECL